MKIIDLHLIDNVWHATHNDPEIKRLFGSDTIATAFTAYTKANVLQAELERLNPHTLVRVHA